MFQEYLRIVVYVPIDEDDTGPSQRIAHTSQVQAILDVLRPFEFAGTVGTYKMVVELSGGEETFTPTEESTPAHGRAGAASTVASARLLTYVPASTPRSEVDRMVDEIASAHPWEHPVIEIAEVSLWMP